MRKNQFLALSVLLISLFILGLLAAIYAAMIYTVAPTPRYVFVNSVFLVLSLFVVALGSIGTIGFWLFDQILQYEDSRETETAPRLKKMQNR